MNEAPMVAASTIAWFGAALGFLVGAVGYGTNFCTLGAVSDVINMGAWRRARMWIFAAAVAIIVTGIMQATGVVDTTKSIYNAPKLLWLSHIVGGLLFGVGMTLAGGCGYRTLVRLGGGNMRALVVFAFVAIAAFMTMKGLFAVWRVAALDRFAIDLKTSQDLPSMIAGAAGIDRRTALILVVALLGGGLAIFALAGRELRRREPLIGAFLLGLLVAAGWYVSGHIGYVAEDPNTLQEAFIATNSGRAESMSFIAPYAYTLELLTYWSDTSRIVTFGVALGLGVIAGAGVYAAVSGRFRIEAFHDIADLRRHLLGAVLMGFGGVTALGCSIGQGVTGLSTLSLGSLITALSIVAGCTAAVKYDYWRASAD